MNTYLVWMQMDLAKVFKVQLGGPKISILHRHEIKHHTSRDPENHKNCDRLFRDVSILLADADEVYVMGPGLAKDHFKSWLDSHNYLLSGKIVGTKTLELMSDARLLEQSREFFKKRDVFEQVVS